MKLFIVRARDLAPMDFKIIKSDPNIMVVGVFTTEEAARNACKNHKLKYDYSSWIFNIKQINSDEVVDLL